MTNASKTVTKALQVFRVIGTNDGLTLTEISDRLNFHKSTALRLINALMEEGFVIRDQEMNYRIGPAIYSLDGVMPSERILVERTRPLITSLTEQVKETIHVASRIGLEIVYVDKIEPARSLRMASRLGETAPMHSTALGKAILAFSDDGLLNAVISNGLPQQTDATITEPEEFIKEIQKVRRLGYAVDNMENEANVRCVAAPIIAGSQAIGAISVSAPSFRLEAEDIPGISSLITYVARQASEALGTQLDEGKPEKVS